MSIERHNATHRMTSAVDWRTLPTTERVVQFVSVESGMFTSMDGLEEDAYRIRLEHAIDHAIGFFGESNRTPYKFLCTLATMVHGPGADKRRNYPAVSLSGWATAPQWIYSEMLTLTTMLPIDTVEHLVEWWYTFNQVQPFRADVQFSVSAVVLAAAHWSKIDRRYAVVCTRNSWDS